MYIVPISGRAVRLSMSSHALSVVSLATLSFVLIEGPSRGWCSVSIVTAGVLMVLTASLIVLRERSGAHPILPRELLRVPGLTAINLAGFLNNFAAFGQIFLLGLFFQEGQVSNALRAGVLLLPTMAAVTTGNTCRAEYPNASECATQCC
jgi:MFS transporter, DHA2 family, methylenomycin A resistance protein